MGKAMAASIPELPGAQREGAPHPGPHHAGPHHLSADARLLEGLLAGLIDAVIVIDAEGTVVRASASVGDLLGWPPGDLVGQNVRVITPEPHRSAHDGYLRRYHETGRTWILGTAREFDVVRRDGSLVPCELCVSRIDLPIERRAPDDGEPPHMGPLFCGTLRSIVERRRTLAALEQSEARFRAVFEHENEFVLLLDGAERVTDVNLTALERTGQVRESVIGRLVTEIPFWMPAGNDGDPRIVVQRALARADEVGVATARLGVRVLREPVAEGAPIEYIEVPHELSVRVVPDTHPSLPRKIIEIRDVAALVAAERRESSVMRSLARVGEEAAVLAHELRSPVSALELALKAVARQLGADERLLLDDLRARMRRLEDLLRRTLSFSRPLDLDLAPVPASVAFGAALERESATLARAHLRPTVHIALDTPPLAADPRALDDLLANLVRNASEAQPNGGRLRLEAAPSADGWVRVVVEDGGPGIPVAEREAVFRPFRTTKPDGTGLGLALVRKIVEEHGATIRLTDAKLGGLRILLEWPAASPTDPAR